MTAESLATVNVVIVVLGWLLFMLAFLLRPRVPHTTTIKRDTTSLFGMLLEIIAIGLVWSFKRPSGTPFIAAPLFVQGLILVGTLLLTGFSTWLIGAAVRVMGKQWALSARIVDNHQLVTHGPFGLVRNPIYAGLFYLMIATAVALSHRWVLLVSIPLFLAGTVVRIRAEEKLLRDAFGTTYTEYCRRVPALIPWVW